LKWLSSSGTDFLAAYWSNNSRLRLWPVDTGVHDGIFVSEFAITLTWSMAGSKLASTETCPLSLSSRSVSSSGLISSGSLFFITASCVGDLAPVKK
jgi:hypothetical protein